MYSTAFIASGLLNVGFISSSNHHPPQAVIKHWKVIASISDAFRERVIPDISSVFSLSAVSTSSSRVFGTSNPASSNTSSLAKSNAAH